jgi:hypothetical protein
MYESPELEAVMPDVEISAEASAESARPAQSRVAVAAQNPKKLRMELFFMTLLAVRA